VDRALAAALAERCAAEAPNVEVITADVLRSDLGALAGGDYLLAGNVPYYITTPILFHALEGALPRRAVFLVQREVAERAVAPAGSDAYGALSVNLQAVAHVEQLFTVAPGAFQPAPSVDSAVLRVTPRAEPLVLASERGPFRRFVQAAFGQRRKQLASVIRSSTGSRDSATALLESIGVDPMLRPERLDAATFVRLFRAVREREG
jgi:16S rRNA (adenine1518-N6/adenine1519-N6)-dimethyltransferase